MALDPSRIGRRVVRVLFASIVAYYALWGGEYSAFDLLRIAERERAESELLTQVRMEVDSLSELVTRLEDDAPAIERVARERFGMIRRGELLYRFVDGDGEEDQAHTRGP